MARVDSRVNITGRIEKAKTHCLKAKQMMREKEKKSDGGETRKNAC